MELESFFSVPSSKKTPPLSSSATVPRLHGLDGGDLRSDPRQRELGLVRRGMGGRERGFLVETTSETSCREACK